MSTLARSPRVLWLLAVAAAATLLLTTALTTALVPPASAHGSVVDPASRNYSCWQRWGSDFQNPRMATEDPMCWQAWQADPNAMWNWNGLFREGVAGNHQGAIPNGQLCSGGRTQSGRYNALDTVGAWKTTAVSSNFRVRFFDQASHGADYIRVYVTRQGFNPLTEQLGWDDLVLSGQIGNTPASQWKQETGGVSIEIPVNASGRTGRHIVYTIWQASHLDQSYYLCSDVDFSGGTGTPPPTTPPPTTPPPAGACTATYAVTGQWSGGFQAEVRVTAGGSPTRGWSVSWNYTGGQQVTSAWNATVTSNGTQVTARNVAHNGSLAAGASTTFGFLGSWNGTNPLPLVSCTTTS
ncbi:cellulose-binding protein [Micromonospora sp. BL4]|uniref:lytic polysaccharide monooxygenase auxiliary activity family 9 protein n=1 Tax=Micromonospora sp. BL4 TaxID=2478710 RepID=UPI000EF5AE79|nr:lytic polysaccharide monooxygenase [Micromonospora sp. BL4]RLP92405.1 cellulose-binding protein [Micromonospora sp. BL4]